MFQFEMDVENPLKTMLDFFTDELSGAVINTLYLWPIACLLYALYTLSDNIAKTRLRLLKVRQASSIQVYVLMGDEMVFAVSS